MRKLIATGKILETATAIVTGSVYVNLKANGTEDDAAKSHIVTLYVKQLGVASMPTDAVKFTDIEALGTLKVPGFNGHADVTVDTPVEVRYVKSKAFELADNKAQINTVIRYVY